MQVHDEFVDAVREKSGESRNEATIIQATLAVAAERGLVVPEGAEWRDAIQTESGNLLLRFSQYRPLPPEKLVRVAIVEIKE